MRFAPGARSTPGIEGGTPESTGAMQCEIIKSVGLVKPLSALSLMPNLEGAFI